VMFAIAASFCTWLFNVDVSCCDITIATGEIRMCKLENYCGLMSIDVLFIVSYMVIVETKETKKY